MFIDISLDCAVSQRPLYGTLVRVSRQLSLMFPYSRRMIIVLRRSPYGVFLTDMFFGLFVPLPPDFDRISPGSKHFVGSGFYRIVFLKSAVCVVFHSRYQSTLIPVPPSIRPS